MLILPAEGPNLPERGGKVSLSALPSRLPSCGSGSWWPVAGEEASRGAAAPRSGTQVHPGLQHLLASVTCQLTEEPVGPLVLRLRNTLRTFLPQCSWAPAAFGAPRRPAGVTGSGTGSYFEGHLETS